MSTETANIGAFLEGLRSAVEDAGLRAGLGVKPDTTAGQPWALISLMSTVFDGDIEAYNSNVDVLVQVRSVGYSVQQAHAAYWRADAAVMAFETFDNGVVTFRTREALTAPTRDDATFPDRPVYYVDATYRAWPAPAGA